MGKRSKGQSVQKTPSAVESTSRSNLPAAAAGTGLRLQQTSMHTTLNDCYPLNKLCRLCLLSNSTMEPIFAYPGDISLSQKIFQCTNLEIHENEDDGIPSSICSQCKRQLDQCHEFRLLCWKNNEVLQNLHALLKSRNTPVQKESATPNRKDCATPIRKECATPNPFVQVEKLSIGSGLLPQSTPLKRPNTPKELDTISLNQLYKPRGRAGRKTGVYDKTSGFTRELVIRLVPISPSLVQKYKKATAAPVNKSITQTKAAVKSYAPPEVKKPRKPLPKLKVVFKPSKQKSATKAKKKGSGAKVEKVKGSEIAVPPKKRKQNFEEPTETATAAIVACTLCTQTFSNQKNLGRHMATHENNRKQSRVFNCDICKKEYLKASQLTDHLRSAEHVRNAVSDAPDEADVSILPDESEETAAPDVLNNGGESVEPSQDYNGGPAHLLADTSDLYEQIESLNEHFAQNDGASSHIVIPIDSDSTSSSDVQYGDVCSANDTEALFNSLKENIPKEKRRVSFANTTEIVD